ncbi:MAG: transcription-repair coupling factor, partial [Rhodospirillaceae bacterium]|nr:transcription-repair coupling factor [Rhodospirillaceae bacterium]
MERFLDKVGARILTGVPDGFDALVLAERARSFLRDGALHVARDEGRLTALAEAVAFFAPEVEVVTVPAWDCLPYDRVSPNAAVVARRIDALCRLTEPIATGKSRLVITTVSAVLQRVPKAVQLTGTAREVQKGSRLALEDYTGYLAANGYVRAEQVMEPGEFAVRGGLIDIFPPGIPEPVRIDLFGDEVEGLRFFDPVSQRTTGPCEAISLKPMSEIILTPESISRFRSRYRELFGAVAAGDALYESIAEGRRFLGMEHWLPLFHDGLETLLDYMPTAGLSLDHDIEEAVAARFETIRDYYHARRTVSAAQGKGGDVEGMIYNPVPPNALYIESDEWLKLLSGRAVSALRAFAPTDLGHEDDGGGRPGRDFADVRARPNENVYEAFLAHLRTEQMAGRKVVLACTSSGSRARLKSVLKDHGFTTFTEAETWAEALNAPQGSLAAISVVLERGFVTQSYALITEQDLLGDRLVRTGRKRRKADAFIAEASQLSEGDLVVHIEHGIGRYESLETLTVGGAPHDCLRIIY